jgi:hypothetical protein
MSDNMLLELMGSRIPFKKCLCQIFRDNALNYHILRTVVDVGWVFIGDILSDFLN